LPILGIPIIVTNICSSSLKMRDFRALSDFSGSNGPGNLEVSLKNGKTGDLAPSVAI